MLKLFCVWVPENEDRRRWLRGVAWGLGTHLTNSVFLSGASVTRPTSKASVLMVRGFCRSCAFSLSHSFIRCYKQQITKNIITVYSIHKIHLSTYFYKLKSQCKLLPKEPDTTYFFRFRESESFPLLSTRWCRWRVQRLIRIT